MPKTKTSSSVKKRFKVTAGGKLLRRHGMKSHNLTKKTSKRKRAFDKNFPVAKEWVMALRGTGRAFAEMFALFALALRVTATVLRVTSRLVMPKSKGN